MNWLTKIYKYFKRRFFSATVTDLSPLETQGADVSMVAPLAHTESVVPLLPKRIERKNRRKTLNYMLDNLDACFKNIGMPNTWEWAIPSKDTLVGLRKMGPHISEKKKSEFLERSPKIKTLDGSFGGLMFVAYELREEEKNELMPLAFVYALLLSKPPWYVSYDKSLKVFECGGAWKSKHGKLVWSNWYVMVNKATGEVKVCDCINYTIQHVKGGSYTQKQWGLPEIAHAGFPVEKDRKADILAEIFVECFEAWQISKTCWKISVSKMGQRVTWTIPQNETKYYFADRKKTVIDSSGRKKKIIHHVNQHERVLADGSTSIVREHIRGLNKFEWNGYSVNIIAPKFHVTAHEIELGAEDTGEDGEPIPKGMVSGSKFGKILADLEGQGRRKELPSIH